VAEVHPILIDLSKRLSSWEKQYKSLESRVASLNQLIERDRNLVSTAPGYLDLPVQRDQVIAMKTVASALGDTMTRLEVDSIPAVQPSPV
jgi:hypothetical protein